MLPQRDAQDVDTFELIQTCTYDPYNQKKKHKLPENLIMNLTGRKRNYGSFTVTEKFKSALHFNTAFGHTLSILYYQPLLTKITVIQYHFVKLSHMFIILM